MKNDCGRAVAMWLIGWTAAAAPTDALRKMLRVPMVDKAIGATDHNQLQQGEKGQLEGRSGRYHSLSLRGSQRFKSLKRQWRRRLEDCTLTVPGSFGNLTNQAPKPVSYTYQAVFVPGTTAFDVSDELLPLLEHSITEGILPDLFECPSSIAKGPTQGVSIKFDDSVAGSVPCLSEATGECVSFRGNMLLFGDLINNAGDIALPLIEKYILTNYENLLTPLDARIVDVLFVRFENGAYVRATAAPTTPAPTSPEPTTATPTLRPTTAPITPAPTVAPVTPVPTAAPITQTPTGEPPTTAPPTTKSPTPGPVSAKPATNSPTLAPIETTAGPTLAPLTSAPINTNSVPTNPPVFTDVAPTRAPTSVVDPRNDNLVDNGGDSDGADWQLLFLVSVAMLVLLILICVLLVFLRRWTRRKGAQDSTSENGTVPRHLSADGSALTTSVGTSEQQRALQPAGLLGSTLLCRDDPPIDEAADADGSPMLADSELPSGAGQDEEDLTRTPLSVCSRDSSRSSPYESTPGIGFEEEEKFHDEHLIENESVGRLPVLISTPSSSVHGTDDQSSTVTNHFGKYGRPSSRVPDPGDQSPRTNRFGRYRSRNAEKPRRLVSPASSLSLDADDQSTGTNHLGMYGHFRGNVAANQVAASVGSANSNQSASKSSPIATSYESPQHHSSPYQSPAEESGGADSPMAQTPDGLSGGEFSPSASPMATPPRHMPLFSSNSSSSTSSSSSTLSQPQDGRSNNGDVGGYGGAPYSYSANDNDGELDDLLPHLGLGHMSGDEEGDDKNDAMPYDSVFSGEGQYDKAEVPALESSSDSSQGPDGPFSVGDHHSHSASVLSEAGKSSIASRASARSNDGAASRTSAASWGENLRVVHKEPPRPVPSTIEDTGRGRTSDVERTNSVGEHRNSSSTSRGASVAALFAEGHQSQSLISEAGRSSNSSSRSRNTDGAASRSSSSASWSSNLMVAAQKDTAALPDNQGQTIGSKAEQGGDDKELEELVRHSNSHGKYANAGKGISSSGAGEQGHFSKPESVLSRAGKYWAPADADRQETSDEDYSSSQSSSSHSKSMLLDGENPSSPKGDKHHRSTSVRWDDNVIIVEPEELDEDEEESGEDITQQDARQESRISDEDDEEDFGRAAKENEDPFLIALGLKETFNDEDESSATTDDDKETILLLEPDSDSSERLLGTYADLDPDGDSVSVFNIQDSYSKPDGLLSDSHIGSESETDGSLFPEHGRISAGSGRIEEVTVGTASRAESYAEEEVTATESRADSESGEVDEVTVETEQMGSAELQSSVTEINNTETEANQEEHASVGGSARSDDEVEVMIETDNTTVDDDEEEVEIHFDESYGEGTFEVDSPVSERKDTKVYVPPGFGTDVNDLLSNFSAEAFTTNYQLTAANEDVTVSDSSTLGSQRSEELKKLQDEVNELHSQLRQMSKAEEEAAKLRSERDTYEKQAQEADLLRTQVDEMKVVEAEARRLRQERDSYEKQVAELQQVVVVEKSKATKRDPEDAATIIELMEENQSLMTEMIALRRKVKNQSSAISETRAPESDSDMGKKPTDKSVAGSTDKLDNLEESDKKGVGKSAATSNEQLDKSLHELDKKGVDKNAVTSNEKLDKSLHESEELDYQQLVAEVPRFDQSSESMFSYDEISVHDDSEEESDQAEEVKEKSVYGSVSYNDDSFEYDRDGNSASSDDVEEVMVYDLHTIIEESREDLDNETEADSKNMSDPFDTGSTAATDERPDFDEASTQLQNSNSAASPIDEAAGIENGRSKAETKAFVPATSTSEPTVLQMASSGEMQKPPVLVVQPVDERHNNEKSNSPTDDTAEDRSLTSSGEHYCNACGLECSITGADAVTCPVCEEVHYCSEECRAWDREKGEHTFCKKKKRPARNKRSSKSDTTPQPSLLQAMKGEPKENHGDSEASLATSSEAKVGEGAGRGASNKDKKSPNKASATWDQDDESFFGEFDFAESGEDESAETGPVPRPSRNPNELRLEEITQTYSFTSEARNYGSRISVSDLSSGESGDTGPMPTGEETEETHDDRSLASV